MARDVACDALLGLAVFIAIASSIGVLVMPDVFQKLHYVTPLAIVVPVLVGFAVLVHSGWTAASGQTFLAVLVLVMASPFVSHATIRAAKIRADGDWRSAAAPSSPAGDDDR